MTLQLNVEKITSRIKTLNDFQTVGRLVSAQGSLRATVEATVGELCLIENAPNQYVTAEVIGFEDRQLSCLLPLESNADFQPGSRVIAMGRKQKIPVGFSMLGRVIDPFGQAIDGLPQSLADAMIGLDIESPNPLTRPDIDEVFQTRQRAIDGMLTLGKGQRVGLFAGSGVGKSTLLGEIAKHAVADVNVVAMVGERGREVRPFIADALGPQGLAKSIVIVATSDAPALARVQAAKAAVAIANWFRGSGCEVLLMIDSLTRLAFAQREIGLLLGEPPSSRGFPPSSLQIIANLMEPLGRSDTGSITGIMTVLVDGDDFNEPVADAARGILDGHILLDRDLAEKNHFPAINVARSISRLSSALASPIHNQAVAKIRDAASTYEEYADLIRLGMYQMGTSPKVDSAVEIRDAMNQFLRQSVDEMCGFDQTTQMLSQIAQLWNG